VVGAQQPKNVFKAHPLDQMLQGIKKSAWDLLGSSELALAATTFTTAGVAWSMMPIAYGVQQAALATRSSFLQLAQQLHLALAKI